MGTEHDKMKWGDVVLKRDEQFQLDYLRVPGYNGRATKTRTGVGVTDSRTCPTRMYATPNKLEKCSVSTYILYGVKRPDGYLKDDDLFNISVVTNEKQMNLG